LNFKFSSTFQDPKLLVACLEQILNTSEKLTLRNQGYLSDELDRAITLEVIS